MDDQDRKDEPPDNTIPMDTRQNTTTKRGKGGGLGRDVQAKIGQQLRSYYDGLIEPTPDRFVDLLRQLDKPGGKGSANEP